MASTTKKEAQNCARIGLCQLSAALLRLEELAWGGLPHDRVRRGGKGDSMVPQRPWWQTPACDWAQMSGARCRWLRKPSMVSEWSSAKGLGAFGVPAGDGYLSFSRIKSHKAATGPRTHQENALYMERNPSKSKTSLLLLLLSNDI